MNQDITKLKLIETAGKGDMESFLQYSILCFGKPSMKVFNYEIAKLKTGIREDMNSENEDISGTAKKLDKLLLMDKEPAIEVITPDHQLFETARKYAKPPFEIGEILDENISPDILKIEFEKVLRTLGLYEWVCSAGGQYILHNGNPIKEDN